MSVFCDLINEYNIKLKELTNLFNINFIDTNSLASTTGKNNFHISTKGHIDLANIILTNIYKNIKKTKIKRNLKYCTIISNNGIKGIKEKMKIKYIDIMKQKDKNKSAKNI